MSFSCSSDSEAPAESVEGSWHFSNFSKVRAFRLNWNDESSFDRIIDQDGKLNSTRLPLEGVVLSEDQVSQLEAAVTGSHPMHPVAACFYPHHAFIFYDDAGKIVGDINICFLCSNYSGMPEGFAQQWNLEALADLVQDIGMPLRNPEWD